MSTPTVLWFKQLGMHDVELVGGKNSSLGEMIQHLTKLGVSVPDGFATTAEAYREFLAHEGLADRINAQLDALGLELGILGFEESQATALQLGRDGLVEAFHAQAAGPFW